MTVAEAYIYDAYRTPRGRAKVGGGLRGTKPVDLAIGLLGRLSARVPSVDLETIDDVVLGIVTPLAEQGAVLPKTAALAAGLPETVPGVQINRFCGSGLEAVNLAAQKVRSGWEHAVIAGGVESMSRVPLGSDGGPLMNDPQISLSLRIVPQGVSADLIATIEGFSRSDVDEFAARSHQRAAHAWRAGFFDRSVEPVIDRTGCVVLATDEHVRAATTTEGLAGLKPSFLDTGRKDGYDAVALQRYHWIERINHVHHAGNSSGLVDGAALVVVADEGWGKRSGLSPRARVVAAATSGADPTIMLTGPTPATRKLLDAAGLTVDDIDIFEVNEAFAAIPMKFMKDFGIGPERMNVNGGAIAMGHPVGATGAMLVGTVVDELERRNARRAVVAVCTGGGMGVATLIERV